MLSKCPYCGSSEVVLRCVPGPKIFTRDWKVKCRKCRATGPSKTSELEAERAWDELSYLSQRLSEMRLSALDSYEIRRFIDGRKILNEARG